MTWRVSDGGLVAAPVAVTMIAQRPVVELERRVGRPVRRATGTVTGVGPRAVALGAGRRRPGRRRAGRRSDARDRHARRVRRRALDRDRAVLEGRAVDRLVDGQRRRLDLGERHRDDDLARSPRTPCRSRGRSPSILNWFLPRRRSTVQAPRRRSSRPSSGAARRRPRRDRRRRGSTCPRGRSASVSSSSGQRRRRAAFVTASVGGLVNRRTWTVRYTPTREDHDRQERRDDDARRERQPAARLGERPRDRDDRRAARRRRRARAATGRGPPPGRGPRYSA